MSETSAPPSSPIAYLPALDGVRAIAILMVLLRHSIGFARLEPTNGFEAVWFHVVGHFWCGVDLFFVLSGFLITSILIKTKGSPHYFRNFYWRRSLRIFPLYYLFLILMLWILPAVLPRLPSEWETGLRDQAWFWLYLTNIKIFLTGDWITNFFDHGWTLAIEEQFYLFWPIVVLITPTRRLAKISAALIVAALAIRFFLHAHGFSTQAIRVFPLARLDALGIGALIASIRALEGDGGKNWNRLKRASRVLGLALGIVGFGFLRRKFFEHTLIYTAFAFLFAWLVMAAVEARGSGRLRKFLERPALRPLGLYSYGFYLLHQPLFAIAAPAIRDWIQSFTQSPLAVWWGLALILGSGSFVLAALSYRFVERPFLRLKDYFSP